MVTYREAAVTDDAALALLTEYFESRTRSFPAGMGRYRTVFPDPSDFLPPGGIFLIVESEDLAGEPADVGCGGFRELGAGVAGRRFEIKHLWLQPHVRGRGFGRALLAELERRATEHGAAELVLDTNSVLEAAGSLYASSGYVPIAAYNDNLNATNWFRKTLKPPAE